MSSTRGTRSGRRVRGALFLVVLALLSMLVGAEGMRVGGDAEEADGRAAFYAQPSPVQAGAPGALVKTEELVGVPPLTRAWRIMYHSTDLDGADVIVTGVLVVPLGQAPAGGRTVVSWGHPTTGSAPECAPSYQFDPFLLTEGLRAMLDRGYAVVGTDYAGMGTAGPDSYLVAVTEARNVLDAVRAAQGIPEAQAGEDVVLWGHSQGGQAVLRAAEIAGSYAPELRIRAVAAAAPAAQLDRLLKAHLDDISGVTIGSYAFPAYARVYGATVPGARLDGILTPAAIADAPRMNRLCLLSDLSELHAIGTPLVGNFFLADPTVTEPWRTLLIENSAGSVPFAAPLFLAQGESDALVIPADTRAFAEHERAMGMDVTFEAIPFADHGTVAYLAIPALMAWLDRLG